MVVTRGGVGGEEEGNEELVLTIFSVWEDG